MLRKRLLIGTITLGVFATASAAIDVDFNGGFMFCSPGECPSCSGFWDVEESWIYDCPLPPPQVCDLQYPDEPSDNADIFWQTAVIEGGSLQISYLTLTIGALRIGVPSHPTCALLNVVFGSENTADTLTCATISLLGSNGDVTVRVTDYATLETS